MAEYNRELYAAILGEKPLAIYEKTINGKVSVKVLDPFSADEKRSEILEIILEGEVGSPESQVHLYSEKEIAYFKRANAALIKSGIVVSKPVDVDNIPQMDEETLYTDEDIEELLVGRYYKKFEQFIREYIDEAEEQQRRSRLARVVRIARKLDIKRSRADLLKAKMLEYGLGGVEL